MKNYVLFIDKINRVIEYLLLIFMIILVAAVTLQILSRLPFLNFKTSIVSPPASPSATPSWPV